MANKVLAFIENKEGEFKNTAFEVITEAKKLSGELGCEFTVLTIGKFTGDLEEKAKKLGSFGAGKVLIADIDELNSKSGKSGFVYSKSAFAKVISEVSKSNDCNIILLSASMLGKDLAPRIAVKTDSAVAPDVTEINIEGGDTIAKRPVYAGKSNAEIKFNTDKIILTLRPNVFKPEKAGDSEVETTKIDVSSLDLTASDFSDLVKETIVSTEKLDVAEADKIVSGGRGLKGPENFHLVEELANAIGGATGASRAVVDAGWRPHAEQVGQTGKTVSPSLYIACGISGAIQHLAGMSSSKCIVAINKDKDAPIFQVADYGIVGDVFEIIPALTNEFKKFLSQ